MLLTLLNVLPELTTMQLGVAGGIFRGADRATVENFLRKYNVRHVEIHQDNLGLIGLCRKLNISCSYHCRMGRGQEEDTMEISLARNLAEENGCRITLHPDARDFGEDLELLQDHISFENLDLNSHDYRRAGDFEILFERFPRAGLCLDLGHLWDETKEAEPFIERLGDRISQVHLCQTCPRTGNHMPTVSGEFLAWVEEVLPKINARFVVLEPPLEVNITHPGTLS